MDNLLFPELAKKQFNIECNNIIEQERQSLAQREKEIKKDCAKKNLRALNGRFWLIFVVFILFFGPLGAVIAFLLREKINFPKGSGKHLLKANKLIEEERKKFEENIEKIKQEYEIRFADYVKLFEKKAQDLSVNYAESAVAVEVIEWMTAGFCKTIDSADRRSHIQEISVPFIFRTYRNKIECQLGIFDFEIKRCDELKNPLEQTALARAIAAAVQLNITMQYPEDISGTTVVTNIFYAYDDDNVATTITYTAPNGNYTKTRDWTVS